MKLAEIGEYLAEMALQGGTFYKKNRGPGKAGMKIKYIESGISNSGELL